MRSAPRVLPGRPLTNSSGHHDAKDDPADWFFHGWHLYQEPFTPSWRQG